MIRTFPRLIRPLLLCWLFACVSLMLQAKSSAADITALFFLVLTAVVWATLFCLPVILLAIAASKSRPGTRLAAILRWSVFVSAFLVIVFLVTNYKLYALYGFYTNFFVINLISTTGGVAAMGISTSTWNSALAMIAIGALLFYAATRWLPVERLVPCGLTRPRFSAVVLACLLSESMIYVYADYVNIVPVLNTADEMIWYVPVTADTLLSDLGLPRVERFEDELAYSARGGNLAYFDENLLEQSVPQTRYNIVWLVAESWRADSLNAKTMPNTYAFANEQQWFQNHYSGGNGTRMGMFTQFYGLYGHYWFDVLRHRQPPLLIEQLQAQEYDFAAFTSSAFTYPEFDKTVFGSLAPDDLQEYSEGHGWERDQKNTTDLIQFIEQAESPFFAFMFFESAHANYYFPDEDIIEPDFLQDFNYLTVDLEAKMPQIKARYLNAAHHLDRQLQRVYATLEEQNLMENTIVVVTGDHGEEFMENGRWGHNSTFSQPQIRVPLIVHLPKTLQPKVHTAMTSHLDIPATVFAALGVDLDPSTYSFGSNLFSEEYTREFAVVSDWHGNTLVTPEVKIIFSLKGAAYDARTTDIADKAIELQSSGLAFEEQLADYLQLQNQFFQ